MTRDVKHPGLSGGDLGMWERATYLAKEGHSVCVVTSRFPGAAREETIEGIRVVRLGAIRSLWWGTFLYYMRRCRGHFDAVVTEGFGGSRIPRFAPLYVKTPIITEWHQIHRDLFAAQYPRWLQPVLNALERVTAFVHRDTTLVVRSVEWKEAFPKLGFKPDKIRVVPACIDASWLLESPATSKELQVVWIGKFRRYKNPDHIIRAMPHVLRSFPTARLVLMGRHDDLLYEKHLQSLVAELRLTKSVEFRFNVSEDEKRAILRASRVMVLPSAVEGFGIVVLEANASGVPVIASSGVPESVVRSGRNGLRFAYGDVSALGEAIIALMQDSHLAKQLAVSSSAFAAEFRWEKVCAQYEDMILDLVDTGPTRLGAPAAEALQPKRGMHG